MTSRQSRNVAQMMAELLQGSGFVECNSGKNRKKVCALLTAAGRSFTSVLIGHNTGRKSLHPGTPRGYGYRSIVRYAAWIKQGRILACEAEIHSNDDNPWTAEIAAFFVPGNTATVGDIARVLSATWPSVRDEKHDHVLWRCGMWTSIKRITVTPQPAAASTHASVDLTSSVSSSSSPATAPAPLPKGVSRFNPETDYYFGMHMD